MHTLRDTHHTQNVSGKLLLMRIQIINFIFLFSTLTVVAQEQINYDTLKVSYLTGDEVIHFKSFVVFKDNDKLKSVNLFEYFVGTESFGCDTIELNYDQQELIQLFLKRAIQFKDTCTNKYRSTSSEDYTIKIDDRQLSIVDRFCDWGLYDYNKLEQTLFADYFFQLKSKREKFENHLDSIIQGNWTVTAQKPPWKWGTKIELDKQGELSDHVGWIFNIEKMFSTYKQDPIKLAKLESYKWDIDEGSVLLIIDSKVFNESEEGPKLYKGATFKLLKSYPNKIELEFLWR